MENHWLLSEMPRDILSTINNNIVLPIALTPPGKRIKTIVNGVEKYSKAQNDGEFRIKPNEIKRFESTISGRKGELSPFNSIRVGRMLTPNNHHPSNTNGFVDLLSSPSLPPGHKQISRTTPTQHTATERQTNTRWMKLH